MNPEPSVLCATLGFRCCVYEIWLLVPRDTGGTHLVQAQGRVWNWERQPDKWVGGQASKGDLDGQVDNRIWPPSLSLQDPWCKPYPLLLYTLSHRSIEMHGGPGVVKTQGSCMTR